MRERNNHGNPQRLVDERLGQKSHHHAGRALVQIAGAAIATGGFRRTVTAFRGCFSNHGSMVHISLHAGHGHTLSSRHGHLGGKQALQWQQGQHQGQYQSQEFSGQAKHGVNDNEFHFYDQAEPACRGFQVFFAEAATSPSAYLLIRRYTCRSLIPMICATVARCPACFSSSIFR